MAVLYIESQTQRKVLNEVKLTWGKPGNTIRGSITVPLASCLTGLESAVWTTDNFCVYLQNRLIKTSQTGGQWYIDTSPFSIPWVSFPLS
jgi:hypothetical protein